MENQIKTKKKQRTHQKVISTSIPPETYNEIKEKGYKMPELIQLGLLAKKNNPQLFDRFRDLQEQLDGLKGMNRHFNTRLLDVEKDVDELKEKREEE